MSVILALPIVLISLHILYVISGLIWVNMIDHGQESQPDKETYSIEHIVCFKNESRFVSKKLENSYELITLHNIHQTFVNDNSENDTFAQLQTYQQANTTIINNTLNLGKNLSQIEAVNQTDSDLLLFTDANVFLNSEAVESSLRI